MGLETDMTTPARDTRAELTTYLCLTFGLSAIFWWLIVRAGSLGAHGGAYVFALMWCPGTSGLVTRLIFQHNVRGEGWGGFFSRWSALAYVLPLGYSIVVYGLVWLTGAGGVDLHRFQYPILYFLAFGSAQSLLSATGEELGWRGFLVPTLARTMSLAKVGLISGAIWAAWHVPLIVFADYNHGAPAWYSVLCFAVMVTSMGIPFAWLRLRSGSVWPAAILHASHNLFVQAFFDRVTVDTGPTRYLTGEFGAGLALAFVALAWVFWRQRASITLPNDADRSAPVPVSAESMVTVS